MYYIVSNPAYPGWYKVGTCVDIEKRLASYQTSDPHRAFAIEEAFVATNRFDIETMILDHYGLNRPTLVKGEWIYSNLNALKDKIRMIIKHNRGDPIAMGRLCSIK